MSAQLALALLAVGPLSSALPAAAPPAEPAKSAAAAAKEPRDPIAFLAREWLAKR